MKTLLTVILILVTLVFTNCKKSSDNTPPPAAFTIGQSYQGGIIAYIDGTGIHGLIAAPSDQSTGIQWYNGTNTTTGATDVNIYRGISNTNTIVANQGSGSYAAKLCDDLVLGGYSDWYLPSKNELLQLWVNRVVVGGFANGTYWSSTEYDLNNAWYMDFYTVGVQYANIKSLTYHVRAVRYF